MGTDQVPSPPTVATSVCPASPAAGEVEATDTWTSESSPGAVPAVPVTVGVLVVTVSPSRGEVIATDGAVRSTGVVSTVKVTGALVPRLPVWSVCAASTV